MEYLAGSEDDKNLELLRELEEDFGLIMERNGSFFGTTSTLLFPALIFRLQTNFPRPRKRLELKAKKAGATCLKIGYDDAAIE